MSSELPDTRISNEKILENTGKGWIEWVETLDAWGGRAKTHAEIARYVHELGVGEWWAQGVTVQYEQIIQRRVVGQRSDGSYSGSASKSIAPPPKRVHATFINNAERATWLDPDTLGVRSSSAGKSARFDQQDSDGILSLSCYASPTGKTSVQVQQEEFASKVEADAFRVTWKARLAALDQYLKRA